MRNVARCRDDSRSRLAAPYPDGLARSGSAVTRVPLRRFERARSAPVGLSRTHALRRATLVGGWGHSVPRAGPADMRRDSQAADSAATAAFAAMQHERHTVLSSVSSCPPHAAGRPVRAGSAPRAAASTDDVGSPLPSPCARSGHVQAMRVRRCHGRAAGPAAPRRPVAGSRSQTVDGDASSSWNSTRYALWRSWGGDTPREVASGVQTPSSDVSCGDPSRACVVLEV